jgi:selenide,water dikinase
VGLAVFGELGAEGELLRQAGARPGDALVLSKPLGTGVVLAADRQGLARGAWLRAAHASMLRANAEAARVARACASAATDVSGFGLALHLAGLLRKSEVAARLELSALPVLPGALALLERGARSSFHAQNAAAAAGLAAPPAGARTELLFDPQTSGGLLFSVPAARCEEALAALREGGDAQAARIGTVLAAAEAGWPARLIDVRI